MNPIKPPRVLLGRCSVCRCNVYRRGDGPERYKSGHPHHIHRKGYTLDPDPPDEPDHGHRGWMDNHPGWRWR